MTLIKINKMVFKLTMAQTLQLRNSFARLQVPNHNSAIGTAREAESAVFGYGQCIAGFRLAIQLVLHLSSFHIQHTDGFGLATHNQG
jgi:hypothetical protein